MPDLESADPRARIRRYLEQSQAENTRRSYLSDLRHFRDWCDRKGLAALPASPEGLAGYLSELADTGYAVSTLERRIASIAAAHRAFGCEPPHRHEGVRQVWRGIRRSIGVAPQGKRPLVLSDLLAILGSIRGSSIGAVRDRALLLVGWATGSRRSELADIRVSDLELAELGYLIRISRSKTDQEGKGRLVPLRRRSGAYCPVASLLQWLERSQITDGHLFRAVDRHGRICGSLSGRAIAEVVKRRADAAGLDGNQYGAHSLRSGLCVSAKARGASEIEIMKITGHRSLRGLSAYLAGADVWSFDPAGTAGL